MTLIGKLLTPPTKKHSILILTLVFLMTFGSSKSFSAEKESSANLPKNGERISCGTNANDSSKLKQGLGCQVPPPSMVAAFQSGSNLYVRWNRPSARYSISGYQVIATTGQDSKSQFTCITNGMTSL